MPTTNLPDPSADVHTDAEAALASGRAHEAAGRRLDAIAAYAAALRARPDTDLAQRLVRLRHDAVVTGTITPRVGSWPPDLPDPFPGIKGLPEISPDELTTATLGGAILHHGCVIVRGFQPESAAAALREKVIRSIDARDRALAGEPEPGDDEWHRPFDARRRDTNRERPWVQATGGMLAADAPLVMCELLDVVERAGALAAITGYLGERPAISFHKCVLRKVRSSHPTWHQDGAFMGENVRSVDLWLALSECGSGTTATGLDLVPKRIDDILDTATHGAIFPNSIGDGLVDIVAADAPWVAPHFAPGDAVLFDERFVHRTGVGDEYVSDRYAIESWFFAPSGFPTGYVPILA